MPKIPRIVSGDPPPYVPSHLNYGRYVLDRLINGGDKLALVNGETDERMTYGELVQQMVNASAALRGLGLRRGDVVAVLSENRFEFIVTVVASLCAGAAISSANPLYTTHELTHNLNISKPKFVFCSPTALKTHLEILKSFSCIQTIVQYGGDASSPAVVPFADLIRHHVDVSSFECVDVTGQIDTATILHSSGTTGLPKGVMLTHLNLMVTTVQMRDETFAERQIFRCLSIMPWHHIYGYMSTINLLCANVVIIFMPRYQQDLYLQLIQKYKVTTLLAVPPLVVFLAKSPKVLEYDRSSVLEIWCGAAPLKTDIIRATKERFPNLRALNQGYGMTETGLAATRHPAVDGSRPGSSGVPVSGVRMKVVDLETKQMLGPNEKGEVCIKGPIIMKGYIGDAAATGDVFDEDGYLRTGDIGYYDEDGYFYIVDRLKELVKYKGFQVAPAEVEAVLLQHPGVAESAVVGRPDEVAGELPTAFVVKQPGVNLTEKELIDHVASKLSHAKHLHGGVTFVEEIPKNVSGKLLRRAIKEKYIKPTSKL